MNKVIKVLKVIMVLQCNWVRSANHFGAVPVFRTDDLTFGPCVG
jgi:hypothetical protein